MFRFLEPARWEPDLGDAVGFPSVARPAMKYSGRVTSRWVTRDGRLVVRVIDELGVERSFHADELTPPVDKSVR